MRPIILASALLAALAIPAAAHASPVTYFHFTPDGGRTVSFSIDPSLVLQSNPGVATIFSLNNFNLGAIAFYVPAYVQFANPALGPVDLAFQSYIYDGPQLYTGNESDPIFIPGTYDLVSDPIYALLGLYPGNATLTISQTPEPSSLLLLGTGVLGCVGALRRRFLRA